MPARSAIPSRPAVAPRGTSPSRIPPAVPGEVMRPALLARLREETATARLVLVSAPAGYGKTTLLAQMARSSDLPAAWLDLRPAHRDARRLLADIDDVVAEAAGEGGPVLLVLDDVDVLASAPALRAVESVLAGLAPGARVALGCRAVPGLMLARRLLDGGLAQVTAADLAFGPAEADELLGGAGIRLDPGALAELVERTEGWPAGLRLATLRIGAAPDPAAAARAFAGDDRAVAAYLDEVVLGGLDADTAGFLMRSSILEPLTGDLCDAVLATSGSARRLLELGRSGLMVVGLDDHGDSHRYHRLLGDHLRRELGRHEPQLVPALHRRAARWHEARGDVTAAVRHSLAAGETHRAAGLVAAALPADLTRGGVRRLGAMVSCFGVDEVVGRASLATASAWFHAETRGDLAGHMLVAAERALRASTGPQGDVPAAVATLRAMLARRGVTAMNRDADEGFRLASDDGPWRACCRLLEGVGAHLTGDAARARALLEDGIERAGLVAPLVHALCHAQLALVLLDEGEPVRGLVMARRARAVVEEWGLGCQASAAVVYAALGRALAETDHAGEALAEIGEARRLVAETGEASAWVSVEVHVAAAQAGLAAGRPDVAGEALADAGRLTGLLGDAPALMDRVRALTARMHQAPRVDVGPSEITTAEMRVLLLLPTHHPLREIGELLFLSRFTVKSHAHSVYRKLGVTSRSEAVERARTMGILDPAR